MKTTFGLLFCFCISFLSFSQDDRPSVLKVNLTSLALKTYSIQYEKAISDHFSFALGVSHRPAQRIPFASMIEKYIDAADKRIDYINLENVKKGESSIGLFNVTPELRFYPGRKTAPTGFYLALYGKYERFFGNIPVFVDMPYHGNMVRVELPVESEFKTLSGGLMIGRQFRLGERFTLDWFILGVHLGNIKVKGESAQDLKDYDDQFINELRGKIIDTFQINEKYLALQVDKQGVRIDNARNLKYFNLRGFGFNLGYKF